MKQKIQIALLPTEEGRLVQMNNTKDLHYCNVIKTLLQCISCNHTAQHVYVTVSNEIEPRESVILPFAKVKFPMVEPVAVDIVDENEPVPVTLKLPDANVPVVLKFSSPKEIDPDAIKKMILMNGQNMTNLQIIKI